MLVLACWREALFLASLTTEILTRIKIFPVHPISMALNLLIQIYGENLGGQKTLVWGFWCQQ